MDPLAGIALMTTAAAVTLYALYWVIRKAVAAAIADARRPVDPSGID